MRVLMSSDKLCSVAEKGIMPGVGARACGPARKLPKSKVAKSRAIESNHRRCVHVSYTTAIQNDNTIPHNIEPTCKYVEYT